MQRLVNGVQYMAWLSHPSDSRIKAYRAAGVRCRRFNSVLFIHPSDEEIAISVGQKEEEAQRAQQREGQPTQAQPQKDSNQ